MRYLNAVELQRAYQAGEVQSVAIFADGEVSEVRIVTTDGAAVLADEGQQIALRFDEPSKAILLLNTIGIPGADIDKPARHYDALETAKITSSLAGLHDGSNRVFTADEWTAIRAVKKATRGAS